MSKIAQTVDETLKYMWRNEKNRLFMGILLVFMLLYSIFLAPDYNSHQDINMDELEVEMIGNGIQADNAKANDLLIPSGMTGTTSYIQQKSQFGEQRELYTTLKQGDVKRYLQTPWTYTSERDGPSYIASLFYNLFGEDSLFFKAPRFIEEVPHLNFHIIHEITSLQQIHLFLLGAGPLLLLSGLIFMISDVHTKDQKLSSQKSGIPLGWGKYLLIQSLTALGFVATFYLVFFGLFYLVNGLLHGFGSLSYPISFPQETIGWFILRSLPYILILLLLFTRLNTLISLWTRQPIVTIAILLFIVFFSTIYMDVYTADILPFNIGYLPITYIHFGRIIADTQELLPVVNGLSTYSSGLVVLGLTLLVTEILLFITSKRMTRQKFVALGAK